MSQQPDTSLAPGCFGGALTYNPVGTECMSCIFADQCAPVSYEALCTLRKRLGKKAPAPFKPRQDPNMVNAKCVDGLAVPRKIDDHLSRWERRGLRVAPALKAGKNPFDGKKPRWMAVACDVVLQHRTVTRDQLATAFVDNLNWTQETAAAHARSASQALTACGAAVETDGRLTLR